MIDHTGIGVADVNRSATFYDAALAALGMRRVMQLPDNVGTDGIWYYDVELASLGGTTAPREVQFWSRGAESSRGVKDLWIADGDGTTYCAK